MLLRSKRRDASEDIFELPARKHSIRETVANTLRNTQKRLHTNEIAKMTKQLDVVPDPMEGQLETNEISKRDKLDIVADTMPPHQTNEISKVNRLDVVADPKQVTVTWQIENQDDEELANVGDYEPSMEGSKTTSEVLEQADKRVKLMVEQMLEEKFQSIEKMIPKTPTSQPSQPSQPSVMQIKDIASPETPFQESEVERGSNWREDIPKRSILHLKSKAIMGSSSKVSSTVQKINDACRRCILFQYHEENIVAEGTVINTNPDAVIHNQPIEKGCYVVSIDKALNKTAYLCHPTLEFKKVVDAEKSFVQWPSQFITML